MNKGIIKKDLNKFGDENTNKKINTSILLLTFFIALGEWSNIAKNFIEIEKQEEYFFLFFLGLIIIILLMYLVYSYYEFFWKKAVKKAHFFDMKSQYPNLTKNKYNKIMKQLKWFLSEIPAQKGRINSKLSIQAL